MKKSARLLLVAAVALGFAGTAQAADKAFTVTSSAFKDGGMLAKKFAGKDANNKNCVGDDISPPLAWKNAPAGTNSFALVVTDPEGRKGLGVVHWVVYNFAASKTSLKEGEGSTPSSAFTGGKSQAGIGTWHGPCPPFGENPHHYTFEVIALDLPPTLPAGLTRDDLFKQIDGHAIGVTGIIGKFGH
jgi:Raf kinase inhibitor-like YbhB/YbcL family protein